MTEGGAGERDNLSLSRTRSPLRVRVSGDLFHGVIPAGAIYVGRSAPGLKRSPYANPYSVKAYGLVESRRLFLEHTLPALDLAPLRGRDLACWCAPDAEWCHADDLIEAANR